MELIRITDLTAQLDISSRSLRYYEQIGLIRSERKGSAQYRYFDADNVERLKQIMVLRKMQIPIKDILRIYQSHDMSVVVEAFVNRIHAIDNEVGALLELKRIVDDFLHAMLKNGIKKISALPLLYEEMDKKLSSLEETGLVSYEQLSEINERLDKPLELRILDLPPMRMLKSKRADGVSDLEGFWDWLSIENNSLGFPGRHEFFEVQDEARQTVAMRKLDDSFINDTSFTDEMFGGGLFAVGGVYADEDIGTFHRRMIKSFDDNTLYEVDFSIMRATLAETVLSPDPHRERLELFLPIKKRLPDPSLYPPGQQAEDITIAEIESANPILWEKNVPLDQLIPIMNPYYRVNDDGIAEYIAYIDKRVLSTGTEVRVPFRVDMEFLVDEKSGHFDYGSDEGSIRFYHGNERFGINMENNADGNLSKEAISFQQPVYGDSFFYPELGKIMPDEFNRLTWIVGLKHFAVIINGEVRYCGVNYPYMTADTRLLPPKPIIIGSNGQGKRLFRSIRVSQIKQPPKTVIKEGALALITKQSNNILPNIHQMITHHYGENYWFNGCAKYVMECLNEKDFDYWFFAGLTGDNLAQVFSFDRFRGDGAADYRLSPEFIESVFDACGYASTYVTAKNLKANRELYLRTLMAYIDKGVPIIRDHFGWGTIVGYEDYGKTLLWMISDKTEPERIAFDDIFTCPPDEQDGIAETMQFGWVFVGEKTRQVELSQIYRDIIRNMPKLLTTHTEGYCFGPEAFRAWAAEIDSGKFDNMEADALDGFNNWTLYVIYVCNLATNGSCNDTFFNKALELNPDLTYLKDIQAIYKQTARMWNNQDGEDLEALGGGFNVTLAVLQNPDKRKKITAKLRELAACMDEVLAILERNAEKL